jgi:glycosyltransferase involved in cell wall biosynthesis
MSFRVICSFKSGDNMGRKRLWIFNHYAVGPDLPGGTRHYNLGRELVRHGYDVTIFASNWNHRQRKMHRLKNGRIWAIESIDGVRFVWLRTFPYYNNDWRRVLNILTYSVRAFLLGLKLPQQSTNVQPPEIIIGSSVHPLAVFVGRFLAWRYRGCFITEVRDLWPQTLIDIGALSASSLVAQVLRIGELFMYRSSDRIITLLPLAHEYICQRGIPREKIVWIANGVDLTLYPTNSEIKAPNEKFSIFYTGSHGVIDDLEAILKAAEVLQLKGTKSIRFVLVGDGADKPRLVARSRELNLSNVEFWDMVAKNLIPVVLKEADACILINKDLPLYKYGISSNKIFDYLASGKPVIMVGNIPGNIVEETGCGITVKPNDPESLAQACIRLSQMTAEERYGVGVRGRQYVEQHYSYEILGNRLAECIEQALLNR